MRALLVIGILGVALLAVACSPHRGWYHGGHRGGYCGYWNGQNYGPYPAQYSGPGYGDAVPYTETGN